MPTRNVVLTAHQADFVEQLVNSGRYKNASEVLREAARIGIVDIEAGAFRSFESPETLERHLATLTSEVLDA